MGIIQDIKNDWEYWVLGGSFIGFAITILLIFILKDYCDSVYVC